MPAELMNLPGFCGGFSKERSIAFDNQRAINLYPVKGTPLSASQKMLVSTPGQKFLLNLGVNAIRGTLAVGTRIYAVMGNLVFQIDSGYGQIQATGTLNTNSGLVKMSFNNNNQIGIVDGENLYILDISNLLAPALTTISAGLQGLPTSICFLNQRFIISLGGTQSAQYSALNDGTTWSALGLIFFTQYPDQLIAVSAINGQLLGIKQTNTEVWLNNPTLEGTVDFVFNYSGVTFPYGIFNPNCYQIIGNNLVMIAASETEQTKIVYTTGSAIQAISSPAIESFIDAMGDITSSFTLTTSVEGQPVFVATFPNQKITICYDFNQQEWHERSDYKLGYWAPLCLVSFLGSNLEIVGDALGNLYQLDPLTFTDGIDGHPLVKRRITPIYNKKGLNLFIHSLQVLFESGLGNINNPVINPMSVSNSLYLTSSTGIVYSMTMSVSGVLSEPFPDKSGHAGQIVILYSAVDNTYWKVTVIDGNPGILHLTQLNPPQTGQNVFIKDLANGVWMLSVQAGILQISNAVTAGLVPPQVVLEISRDGGKTYGNKYEVSMGGAGDYIARSIFNRLGRSRSWVFNLSISAPIQVNMIDGIANVEEGIN